MKKILLFLFFIYLNLMPTFAIAESVPTSSDQDLERFAGRQYRKADRLFTKLNNNAVANSVPMHWRQY